MIRRYNAMLRYRNMCALALDLSRDEMHRFYSCEGDLTDDIHAEWWKMTLNPMTGLSKPLEQKDIHTKVYSTPIKSAIPQLRGGKNDYIRPNRSTGSTGSNCQNWFDMFLRWPELELGDDTFAKRPPEELAIILKYVFSYFSCRSFEEKLNGEGEGKTHALVRRILRLAAQEIEDPQN